jgi:hypothetical protein
VKKQESHRQDLIILFQAVAQTGDAAGLTGYLISNSNLPGRRANLELAAAFGDAVKEHAAMAESSLWELCEGLAAIPADKAPANSSEEFLPFCGAIGIGAIASLSADRVDAALGILRSLANDARWRLREAVCFGLQRMLARRGQSTLEALESWANAGSWLEMRPAAAAVAEPRLVEDKDLAQSALELHRSVFDRVLAA